MTTRTVIRPSPLILDFSEQTPLVISSRASKASALSANYEPADKVERVTPGAPFAAPTNRS